MHASLEHTDALLAYIEDLTGEGIPALERREPLFARVRPPKPLPGQMMLEELAA
jgi:hypothetical protein